MEEGSQDKQINHRHNTKMFSKVSDKNVNREMQTQPYALMVYLSLLSTLCSCCTQLIPGFFIMHSFMLLTDLMA
jgi:hypothetical protein